MLANFVFQNIINNTRLKILALILSDSVLIAVAYLLATIVVVGVKLSLIGLLIVIIIRITVFLFFQQYKSLWQYASLSFLKSLVLSIAVAEFFIMILIFNLFPKYSLQFLISEFAFVLLLIFASRVLLRIVREKYIQRKTHGNAINLHANILIIGAGDAGDMVSREILRSSRLKYNLVGFVDDDRRKKGQKINEIPILGNTRGLTQFVSDYSINEVIIAMPSATGKEIQRIVRECEKVGVKFKITPGLFELITGKLSVNQIRDVKIEDLLGRKVVESDIQKANFHFGKTVLITGAGGSIGSEISEQIFRQNPNKIILLDHSEFASYSIHQSLQSYLKKNKNNSQIISIVGDVKNKLLLDSLFKTHQIQICYHAAAYKHVPLMEQNIPQAIRNNIEGTLNLLEMVCKYEIERFALISTDKAVNPTNVMGASKRICEVLMQLFSSNCKATLCAVRFGNVLGSNGSVIPLFREQIKNGGPVTVTHPDITRFFMTIPEAVNLVLQASKLSTGGEIFILDMGKPVKILNLAQEMIKLSGLELGKDIDIEFTELREGEKMYEELSLSTEQLKTTEVEKVFLTNPIEFTDDYFEEIRTLIQDTDNKDSQYLRAALMKLVRKASE